MLKKIFAIVIALCSPIFLLATKRVQVEVIPSLSLLYWEGKVLEPVYPGIYVIEASIKNKNILVQAEGYDQEELIVNSKSPDIIRLKLKPNRKIVSIHSEPQDAIIYVNELEAGQGNIELEINKDETKTIKLVAEGYNEYVTQISFGDLKDISSYAIKMKIDPAYVASRRSEMANRSLLWEIPVYISHDVAINGIKFHLSKFFDTFDICDDASGWYRSTWHYDKFPNKIVRSRLEIKEMGNQEKRILVRMLLQSQVSAQTQNVKDDDFQDWNRVLNKYEHLFRDLHDDVSYYSSFQSNNNIQLVQLNLAPIKQVTIENNNSKTTLKKGKSAVDINIPETDLNNPNTFVLIFANEDYKNVASVPFAKNDGSVFQQYCQKTLGIPVNNIHYVENASFNDIRIQLAWLNNVCNAFDGNASLIVYYAGHGIPDEASKSAYLLPVDGDGRYVQSAYKLDDMYQKLGAMSAKSVTVFMDACFSGSKREEGMLASARGVAVRAKAGAPQGNMVVFSAATGDETAYPNNDEQHGMFTYYLLKKLQETKGDVTLQDLGDYITTNVRQQSIVKNGKSQTPTVTPSAEASTWQTWKLK